MKSVDAVASAGTPATDFKGCPVGRGVWRPALQHQLPSISGRQLHPCGKRGHSAGDTSQRLADRKYSPGFASSIGCRGSNVSSRMRSAVSFSFVNVLILAARSPRRCGRERRSTRWRHRLGDACTRGRMAPQRGCSPCM